MLPKFISTKEEIAVIKDQFRKIHSLKNDIAKLNSPQYEKTYNERAITDFTYHSNKIEGNELTYKETTSLIKDSLIPSNRSIGDIMDIMAQATIMESIVKQDKFELSNNAISLMHGKLMENAEQWKDNDSYSPGQIQPGTMYFANDTETTYRTENILQNVMTDVNKTLSSKDETKLEAHPLYVAAYLNQNIIQTQPFAEGNDRIGQIVSNAILIKENYAPIIILEQEKDKFKDLLVNSINNKDKKQTVSPKLIQFICEKETQSLTQKLETIKSLQQEKNNNNTMGM